MARATGTGTADRVELLTEMIMEGQPNNVCLTFEKQSWRVPVAQGYKHIKRVWQQIKSISMRATSTGKSCCRGQSRS